jgi:imidazole glycerol-phosphate synthase subunit HisH
MIVIVDYGMGNLNSVLKAVKRCGGEAVISSNLKEINQAKKLILPGVGYFKQGIKNLKEKGLLEVLNKKVLDDKIPILGICLGMQLFTDFSEEGNCEGLCWIKGKTIKFDLSKRTTS